jgi:hypothetical protein
MAAPKKHITHESRFISGGGADSLSRFIVDDGI